MINMSHRQGFFATSGAQVDRLRPVSPPKRSDRPSLCHEQLETTHTISCDSLKVRDNNTWKYTYQWHAKLLPLCNITKEHCKLLIRDWYLKTSNILHAGGGQVRCVAKTLNIKYWSSYLIRSNKIPSTYRNIFGTVHTLYAIEHRVGLQLDALLGEGRWLKARRMCEEWACLLETCNWKGGRTILGRFEHGGGPPGKCISAMHVSLREGYCKALR